MLLVSLGGSSSKDIHGVSKRVVKKVLVDEDEKRFWHLKGKGDGICSRLDVRELRGAITCGDAEYNRVLMIGKSAGGVLAWNYLRYHPPEEGQRFALVLVDAHGAVFGDDRVGPYCSRQDLWWPDCWPENQDRFRVYNVYQHSRGLTGAGFPDRRTCLSWKIRDECIGHTTIVKHPKTEEMIGMAAEWLMDGHVILGKADDKMVAGMAGRKSL